MNIAEVYRKVYKEKEDASIVDNSDYKKVLNIFGRLAKIINRDFKENEFLEVCFLIETIIEEKNMEGIRLNSIINELEDKKSAPQLKKISHNHRDILKAYENMMNELELNVDSKDVKDIYIEREVLKKLVKNNFEQRFEVFDNYGFNLLLQLQEKMYRACGREVQQKEFWEKLLNEIIGVSLYSVKLDMYNIDNFTSQSSEKFGIIDIEDSKLEVIKSFTNRNFYLLFNTKFKFSSDSKYNLENYNLRDIYNNFEYRNYTSIEEEVVEKIIRLSAFTNYNFKKDSDTNNYAKAIGIVRNEDEIGSEIIKMFNLEDLGILETLIAVFILKYSINEIYRLVVDKIEKLNKLKGDLWNEIILEKDSYTNMEIANLIASYENEKDINKINNNIRKMLSNQPVLSGLIYKNGNKENNYSREDAMSIIFYMLYGNKKDGIEMYTKNIKNSKENIVDSLINGAYKEDNYYKFLKYEDMEYIKEDMRYYFRNNKYIRKENVKKIDKMIKYLEEIYLYSNEKNIELVNYILR